MLVFFHYILLPIYLGLAVCFVLAHFRLTYSGNTYVFSRMVEKILNSYVLLIFFKYGFSKRALIAQGK